MTSTAERLRDRDLARLSATELAQLGALRAPGVHRPSFVPPADAGQGGGIDLA